MSGTREQYARAPLAIVTAEVRLGYEPQVKQTEVRDQFAQAVRERMPVLSAENIVNFAVEVGTIEQPRVEMLPQIRATAIDGTVTVALNPQAMLISMAGSAYTRYSDSLGPVISQVVTALHEAAPLAVVHRASIRYIDEIRPDEPPKDVAGWSTWVRAELLGSAQALGGHPSDGFTSTTTFTTSPETAVKFVCGIHRGVTVVDQSLPFGLKSGPETTMFVLDAEAAWAPVGGALLDPEHLSSVFTELHEPDGVLFEWALTDDARAMFRKNEGE